VKRNGGGSDRPRLHRQSTGDGAWRRLQRYLRWDSGPGSEP
jgi:hypothetical protein